MIYGLQKHNSKRRGHALPNYTMDELKDKFMDTKEFNYLYQNWVISGYDRWLKPSLDRKKSNLPYTLDNLQWMTWGANNKKGVKERSKPVNQLSLNGELIESYKSVRDAGRRTGINFRDISRVCKGEINITKGFKWEFKLINNG